VPIRETEILTKAIVRRPGANFVAGLTTANLGAPRLEKALEQHDRYVRALQSCGLEVFQLEADERHPDSTFVEDAAVLTEGGAILTRPGAVSRRGEVALIREALAGHFRSLKAIESPGTVDGGDVCRAGRHFFIGISLRTNDEGARQLALLLQQEGFTTSFVDVRATRGILHLKSGVASLGDRRLALIEALADRKEFAGCDRIVVAAGEEYAANCVRVNDRVIMAAGYPRFQAALEGLGYAVVAVEVSEFRKMDGGLSCLSLRF
jgi:dimethylargininase